MIRFQAARGPRIEAVHRFSVGQAVHLKSWFAKPLRTDETYSVIDCLPARDNEFQYKIRAAGERHDRVAGEDALELIEAANAKGRN